MDFFDQVDLAAELVAKHKRLSRRGLVQQFGGSDELAELLADELIVRGVAHWDGDVLITGSEPVVAEHEPPKSSLAAEPPQPPASVPPAQIRHLTVMFCDVVGSTELSGQIGAEAWTLGMRGFHDVVRHVRYPWAPSAPCS